MWAASRLWGLGRPLGARGLFGDSGHMAERNEALEGGDLPLCFFSRAQRWLLGWRSCVPTTLPTICVSECTHAWAEVYQREFHMCKCICQRKCRWEYVCMCLCVCICVCVHLV